MAFLAGATDVDGLERLRGLFVSFMSGNTTLLGIAIGRGDRPRAGLIAELLVLFVAGAAAGAALEARRERHHPALAATAVACLLTVPLFLPAATVALLCFSMGALNAATSRIGDASIGLTYVTGALVKFGQGLGRLAMGRPAGGGWGWQFAMWVALLGGSVGSAVALGAGGRDRFWPLPALAWSVAGLAGMLGGGEAGVRTGPPPSSTSTSPP